MKKIAIELAVVAMVAAASGCSENARCRCQAVDAVDAQGRPLVTYLDVKSSSTCKKVTKLGFEQWLEGQLVRDLYVVKCESWTDDEL